MNTENASESGGTSQPVNESSGRQEPSDETIQAEKAAARKLKRWTLLREHRRLHLLRAALVGLFAGIVLILEMTGNYQQLSALLVASLIAYLVANQMRNKPVYEALLDYDPLMTHLHASWLCRALLRKPIRYAIICCIRATFSRRGGALRVHYQGMSSRSAGVSNPLGCGLCEMGGFFG